LHRLLLLRLYGVVEVSVRAHQLAHLLLELLRRGVLLVLVLLLLLLVLLLLCRLCWQLLLHDALVLPACFSSGSKRSLLRRQEHLNILDASKHDFSAGEAFVRLLLQSALYHLGLGFRV
jgi:hypothetical protein